MTGEVDVDGHAGGLGCGLEAPAAHRVLGSSAQKGVSGFHLGIGDRAVGGYDELKDDDSADVHAPRELWVDRRDLADDGAAASGQSAGRADCKKSEEKKGNEKTARECHDLPPKGISEAVSAEKAYGFSD